MTQRKQSVFTVSLVNLRVCYEKGYGSLLLVDLNEVVRVYHPSADQGNPSAIRKLRGLAI